MQTETPAIRRAKSETPHIGAPRRQSRSVDHGLTSPNSLTSANGAPLWGALPKKAEPARKRGERGG